MKLIVGLGNPGEKYAKNRHNIGWVIVERWVEPRRDLLSLATPEPRPELGRRMGDGEIGGVGGGDRGMGGDWKIDKKFDAEMMEIERSGEKVLLVKPQTFMNDSGRAVKKIVDFYKIPLENLLVVHDDLDLVLGSNKLQKGKGPYGHNGVLSIEEHMGTKDFYRLRIGIDNRTEETRTHGLQYTLEDFLEGELEKISDTNLLIDDWLKINN